MNTRRAIDESEGPVALSVAFNQDASCFAVGLDTGFCVLNTDPCELRVSSDFNGGIGNVELLGRSNFVALVGGGRQPKFPQNKVVVWDDKKKQPAFTLEFRTLVLRVRLSRTRVVVALQNSVHVYSFATPPQKLSVYETADNHSGICSLGEKLMAFPGPRSGQVQLVEISTGNISIIPAHEAPLQAIELSPDGEVLATASETGTLVRIFATSNCAKLAELRRGVDHATIFSIAINPSSTLLAVTSDKATLHIFDLSHPFHPSSLPGRQSSGRPSSISSGSSPHRPRPPPDDTPLPKWGILSRIPLLPRVFSDTYSFASAAISIDDDAVSAVGGLRARQMPIPGIRGGRPQKGVVAWLDGSTVMVIGAGRDGRWEKFVVGEGEGGKRWVSRVGWRRYLGT